MIERPGFDEQRMLRAVSLPRRIAVVLTGLGGGTAAVTIATLWATEPIALPVRTQLAFAALILVGVAWATFAVFALTRRPLFAIDRVVAASLAVVFSTLMTLGMVSIAFARDGLRGGGTAAGTGLIVTIAAGVCLRRSLDYRAALLARRRELESTVHMSHSLTHDLSWENQP